MPRPTELRSDDLNFDDSDTDQDEIFPESALLAFNTFELVEKLYRAALGGQRVSKIQAHDCGIAFLATTPAMSSLFMTTMRHVHSFTLRSDIVSNSAYTSSKDGLARLPYAQRRLAFGQAICQGLLARFLASAEDLEELVVNLFCHEICHPEVVESDLEDFLGKQRWHRLKRLDIRGFLTSEQQLVDFIARHLDTLQHLTIGDILFKAGTPASFFQQLRGTLAGSLLTAENFQLRGSFATRTDSGVCGRQWLMEAKNVSNQWLVDQLTGFVLGKDEWEDSLSHDNLDISLEDQGTSD